MRAKIGKRIVSLFLSMLMMFCLTACGGEADSGNASADSSVAATEAPTDPPTVKPGVLRLALNVMYNDADGAYYGNEVGDYIEVTGDGQYTLTFDCDTQLSDEAKRSGIKALKNLTSIYIKDQDVTDGLAGKSALVSCDIKYDKIVVDGVEFTITITEPKNAIKSSGIFDTNDPFNSWDGSAVAEVVAVDHVLNMTNLENPKKVEVTFTLSNLVFENQ